MLNGSGTRYVQEGEKPACALLISDAAACYIPDSGLRIIRSTLFNYKRATLSGPVKSGPGTRYKED